jgi:hypothetical protein
MLHYTLISLVAIYEILMKNGKYLDNINKNTQFNCVEFYEHFTIMEVGTVNSTSYYTLWTLYRSYLKGIELISNRKRITRHAVELEMCRL